MQVGQKTSTGTNYISRQQVTAQTPLQKFNRWFAKGAIILGSAFILGGVPACGPNVTVVAPPAITNPAEVPLDQVQDGRVHSGYAIKAGEQFEVTIGTLQAPALATSYNDFRMPDGTRITTIQNNALVVKGVADRAKDGSISGTATVELKASFQTSVNGGTAAAGSELEQGTTLIFLGNRMAISTSADARDAGEIHVADMPMTGWFGKGAERTARLNDDVSVYFKVVAMTNKEGIFGQDHWFSQNDFGTIIKGNRHPLSELPTLPERVQYLVQFPESSEEWHYGLRNFGYDTLKMKPDNVFADVFLNGGQLYPATDGPVRERLGQGVAVAKEANALIFSAQVPLTVDEVQPFNTNAITINVRAVGDGLALVVNSKR